MNQHPARTPFFSPRRVMILAGNTFTQLVRMKIFYFLLIFIVIAIVLNFFRLPHTVAPESVGAEVLRSLKSPLIGVMKLFAVILGIAATALLIPRDLEDRTLYTILAKPVPRLDYLLGKFLGVLALILVGLAAMAILLNVVLHFRTQEILAERMALADGMIERGYWTEADRQGERLEVLRHGPTWSLQGALLAVFLEAAVIAAAALLISTFSSSTLFTVVITTLVYFIGHFVADGREFWLRTSSLGEDLTVHLASRALVVMFPDFRPFGVVDEAIAGQALPPSVLGALALSSFFYVGIYVVLSWFVFSDKEI